jgi:hypothetical protein
MKPPQRFSRTDRIFRFRDQNILKRYNNTASSGRQQTIRTAIGLNPQMNTSQHAQAEKPWQGLAGFI